MRMKPISVIKEDLGINPNGRVQRFFTEACYKRMDKYVPKRDGFLRDIAPRTVNTITYESPYAHAQYVGYTKGPVRHYTTPGTGPYWDKRMLSAERSDLVKEVQKYVDRG